MFSFSVRDFLFLSFIKFESLVNFVLKSREIAYIIEIIYIFQVVYILVFGLLRVIALTRRTFVGKVMSLLLNMLSRLVITFLPRRKRLLISWLQSPSAVILEPKKIKSDIVSTVSPSISHKVMGPDVKKAKC